MKHYKILKKTLVVDSKYFPIEKHIVETHKGKQKEWIVSPGLDGSIIFPMLPNGEVVLQKSYRHGVQSIITEVCAGMLDEGETPKEGAIRELREETGYGTDELIYLGMSSANPSGSKTKNHYFLAKNCKYLGEQQLDDDEQIEVFKVKNIEEAETLLLDSDDVSDISVASIAYVKRYLEAS